MGASFADEHVAFIWDNGSVLELPAIPGGITSRGHAINNRGQVVGRGRLRDKDGRLVWHAFFWDGATMRDLGTLPEYPDSSARDVNDVGQVVGSCAGVGSQAFLWQNGKWGISCFRFADFW